MNFTPEQADALKKATAAKSGVTAEELLEQIEKRGPDHPLHSLIEWDDSRAARLYRLEQVRHVLRSWISVKEDPNTRESVKIRRVLHLKVSKDREAYIRTDMALKRKETRAQLEAECLDDFASWSAKWRGILGSDFVDSLLMQGWEEAAE